MKRTVYETLPQRKNGARYQFAQNAAGHWFTCLKPGWRGTRKWYRYSLHHKPPIEYCAKLTLNVTLPGDE